jgi:hypothetical protein
MLYAVRMNDGKIVIGAGPANEMGAVTIKAATLSVA